MILSFLAGLVVGVLCVFGALGLLASFVAAAWRDGILKHLNGGGL